MNNTPSQPVKRKFLALLCSLPWLSACASTIKDWAVVPSATAPFYSGKPTAVERRTVSTMSGSRGESRYRVGYRTASIEDLSDAATPLIFKALRLGLIPPDERGGTYGNGAPRPAINIGKRVFLVSAKPDILLLVPWTYQMITREGRKPRLDGDDIADQLTTLYKEQKEKFGLVYAATSFASAGMLMFFIELSNVFPDVSGIEVVSDKWDGARSLAQMEADSSLPFKTEPAQGMPGFRRLILR